VTASGKLGKQTLRVHPDIAVKLDAGKVVLAPRSMSKRTRALWGTSRALVNNMVTGVSKGFTMNLEINGVGYRAALEGKALNLQLGYSHDVKYQLPEGVSVKIGEKQAAIAITGSDRRLVGQVAAEIRAFRKPEPYKGKGIKYDTETIRRKEGKKK
jgi:large subunit ribosomal protein L6